MQVPLVKEIIENVMLLKQMQIKSRYKHTFLLLISQI